MLNVEEDTSSGYSALGGHGFDGTLACGLVRCPKYDDTYVTNLGTRYAKEAEVLPVTIHVEKKTN